MRARHPLVTILDFLIFTFAALEFVEAWFGGNGLHLILPESGLQIFSLVMRALAVWHAGRHV